MVIGLTGGIASGKSMVAALLRARGAAVLDADALAREVVEPGQPALAELIARFGADILDDDGRLDRKRLGTIAFADPQARADLNRITHPRIAAASQAEIARLTAAGAPVIIYEAALLVENQAYRWMDGLIVVTAPPAVQLARVQARDGLDAASAQARLDAQLPVADKVKVATWVIDNGGERAATEAKVEQVWQDIMARMTRPPASPTTLTTPTPTPASAEATEAPAAPSRTPTDPPEERDLDGGPRLAECVLLTGFPAFTARRMAAKILAADPTARVHLLTRNKFADEAAGFMATLAPGEQARLQIVIGDVCDMDLGLSAEEYQHLTNEVTTIHHLAGVYWMGVDAASARRVNVDGTRGVVEMAGDCKRLRRLVHWSTAQVSGKRKGVILEEELDAGQRFHNVYEETKFDAERIAADARRRLPVTILRPGVIVGDSRTGEIDKFDGPYYLLVLIATNALQVHLPLPGRGTAPMHLVPIDYVIDAAYVLALDERAAGRTFHLTDPNPLPARRIYELVAEQSNTKPPRGFIPGGLARTLLRTPGIERLAKGPLAFLESFDHQVFYNCRQSQELLAGSGVACPPFDAYVEPLVRYVREVHAQSRTKPEDDVFDPFD